MAARLEHPEPIQRLGERARASCASPLSALPRDDVRLRFGAPLGRDGIDAYVARIDFDTDAVFAAHDDRLEPAGVAHVGIVDGTAELGVSVLPGHRGRGLGGALVARACEYARNRRIGRLWMHCLAENATMMRIARRAGMAIVVDAGEADAWLALPPPDAASVVNEFAADQVALGQRALAHFVLDDEQEDQSWDELRECAEATVGSLRSSLEVFCRDVPKILQVTVSGIPFLFCDRGVLRDAPLPSLRI